MTIDEAQKKLRRALKRLDPAQQRLARKNARSAIAAAIRTLRTAVDEGFPVIKAAAQVAGTKRLGPKTLTKRGQTALTAQDLQTLQEAGVAGVYYNGQAYGPAWAIEILDMLPPVHRDGLRAKSLLRRAKKSVRERKLIHAEIALGDISFAAAASISATRAQVFERVRRDPTFRDAVLVASRVPGMLQTFLENLYPEDDKTMGLRVVA